MEQCPAQSNRCELSLEIGKAAFVAILAQRYPHMDLAEINLQAENAKLKSLIEDQGGVDVLKRCDDRRDRAHNIGQTHAARKKLK